MRFHARSVSIVLGILAFSNAPDASAQALATPELSSSIEAVKGEFKGTEPIHVRFTLTNRTAQALNVLKWHTPLEGLNANVFRVTHNGEPVPYIGRLIKRGAPVPEDYVSISAGQSITAVVDLGEAYGMYETGNYSVEFSSRIFDAGQAPPAELVKRAVFAPKAIRSDTVSFRLSEPRERPKAGPAEPKDAASAKAATFKGCSATQQSTINTAHANAQTNAAGSYILLAGVSTANRSKCDRYTWWFGTYDATRWTTVTDHYSKIQDAFANKSVTYNCGCTSSYYAYVYPNSPYEIYLCNAFWTAPATGTDSQFGTLIHEMSHFNVVAGTDDHVYGQASAHNLAGSNPANAVDNADNHEYFAENTPSRKCGGDYRAVALLTVGLATAVWLARRRGQRAL